jgi:hypothetical protein
MNEKEIRDKKCPQCDSFSAFFQRCGLNRFGARQMPAVDEMFTLFPFSVAD